VQVLDSVAQAAQLMSSATETSNKRRATHISRKRGTNLPTTVAMGAGNCNIGFAWPGSK
jgi:hypothetical protein